MATNKQNLQVHRGETFKLNLTMQNPDGTPMDLTGHDVVLVALNRSTKTSVGEWAGVVDGSRIELKIQDEETSTLTERAYLYRVEDRQPNGDVYWLVYGTLSAGDGDERV